MQEIPVWDGYVGFKGFLDAIALAEYCENAWGAVFVRSFRLFKGAGWGWSMEKFR
jgi:hypothetical protein